MEQPDAWLLDGVETSARSGRLLTESLTGARQGVVRAGDYAVTAPGGAVVRVAAGKAYVRLAALWQGTLHCVLDTYKDVGVPPTGSDARTDLIVIQVVTTTNPWTWDVRRVPGTPGAGVPVQPLDSYRLATVAVPANTDAVTLAMIQSDLHVVGGSGTPVVKDSLERDALVDAGLIIPGETVYREDTQALELYRGGITWAVLSYANDVPPTDWGLNVFSGFTWPATEQRGTWWRRDGIVQAIGATSLNVPNAIAGPLSVVLPGDTTATVGSVVGTMDLVNSVGAVLARGRAQMVSSTVARLYVFHDAPSVTPSNGDTAIADLKYPG